MKQTEQVLDYCKKNKGITSAEAFYKLGIAHLPRRILDLEERGHQVIRTTEHGTNAHSTNTLDTLFCTIRGYYDFN